MTKTYREEFEVTTVPISALSPMPNMTVYRRANGDLYGKLNNEYHVKVRVDEEGVFGEGTAETLDPGELVTPLQT